jgi:hypothetical protein
VRSSDTRVGTQSNRFVPSTEPSSRTTILGASRKIASPGELCESPA